MLILYTFTFFLFLSDIPNGYFIFPLKIDNKSDIKAEDVGPGPAPSPCKTDLPAGSPSITTAFKTPSILLMGDSYDINNDWISFL